MSNHTVESDLDSSPLVSPNKMTSAYDTDISKLREEFPSFSETLIRAYYKTNDHNFQKARLKIKSYVDHKSQTMRLSSLETTSKMSVKKSPIKKETIFGKYKFNYQKTLETTRMDRNSMLIDDNSDDEDDDDEEIVSVRKSKNRFQLNKYDAPTPSTSSVSSNSNKKRKLVRRDEMPKKIEKIHIESDDEHSAEETDNQENIDDDGEDDDYENLEVSKKPKDKDVLKFLNKANDKDLADIADIHIDQAREVIAKRPYTSIKLFITLDFPYETKKTGTSATSKRGRSTKTDGEKIYYRSLQTIQGYNAIESLIKKCGKYGDLIASEIKKWGVDVDTKASGQNSTEDGPGMDFLVVDKQNDVVDDDDIEDAGAEEEKITPIEDKVDLEDNEDDDDDIVIKPSSKTSAVQDEYDEYHDMEDLSDEQEDLDDGDYDEDFEMGRKTKKSDIMNEGLVQKGPKSTKFFNKPPRLLDPSIQLKDYQLSGINWLYLLYCNDMSCILADEMGLGKTCQVISFLAYLKEKRVKGPHLIVVPSSTLENWLREFHKFCPTLKVQPYYGTLTEREELREVLEDSSQYDVLVTTYNLASGNKYDQHFLSRRNFNCVVFDEGHMLKNSLSERFDKLIKIKAHFRLLLTGTPLQNNLKELISLLNFIMPSLFTSQRDNLISLFKQKASTTVDKGYNPLLAQEAIMRAKVMMKPFILRRRKQQVLKHLPPKHIKIVHCDMLEHQQKVYDKQMEKILQNKTGTGPGKKKSNVNYIMMLRKAAIHPLLFRDIYNDQTIQEMSYKILQEPRYLKDGNQEYIREDMAYMDDKELDSLCREFPMTLNKYQLKGDEYYESGKIKKLFEILNEVCVVKGEKLLVFSMFTEVLDILGKVLNEKNFQYLRLDGSTSVNDRQSLIDEFYAKPEIKVFILSTKAGGFGINLVAANNVVIFDQSFNPHDDAQAMDRAHRVGQTKDVSVFTFITRKSIDEEIYKMAQNKLQLDSHISNEEGQASGKDTSDSSKDKVHNMLQDVFANLIESSSDSK